MPRRLAALAGIALCATLCSSAPRARADAPVALQRVVIDRADLEPSPMLGFARLRLYVSVVDLSQGGKVMDVYGDKAWKLKVGGSVKALPYLAGLYDGTGANTAVVLVVQKSFEYSAELASIKSTLEAEVLQKLPPATQVAVIGFGSTLDIGKLGSIKNASAKLASLNAETAPGELLLLDALTKALGQVKNIITDPEDQPVRKLVILIADGNDKYDDRAKITSLGRKAQKDGVRIHAIAYTTGFKGPLRNMGELAWQSLGTIRWPKTAEAIPDVIRKAALEVGHQYVLTFLVDPEEFVGRKLTVTAQVSASNAIESNPIKLPAAPTCAKTECPTDGYCADFHCVTRAKPGGTGVVTWILIIGGALAGLFALLVGIGFAISKLKARPKIPMPPGTGIHVAVSGPGTGMHAAAPAPVAPPPPAVVVGPQLYFMTGPRTGERIGLRHGFLIGKQPGCDIVLDQDGFASSQHAQILMDTAGNCTLYDKGSTNGTFVNGVRVSEYSLTHGVAIRVGSTELRFLAQ